MALALVVGESKTIFLIPCEATLLRWYGVDGIDVVTIAALAQTVVLGVTMGILILQFRSQERATKEAAYQKVLDDYNDVIRTLVDRPELHVLLDDLVKTSPVAAQGWRSLSADEKYIWTHFMMIYALLERVYLLFAKGWIDRSTWQEWETWLAFMAKHPIFARVHEGSRGMFNRTFQDHVSGLLGPPASVSPTRMRETAEP
jgi:hypothetical protein